MIINQLSFIPSIVSDKKTVISNNKQLSIFDVKKKAPSTCELSDIDIIMRVKPEKFLGKKLKKVSVSCITYDIDKEDKNCKYIAFILREDNLDKLIFSLEINGSYISYDEIIPLMIKIASVYNIFLPDQILLEKSEQEEYIEEED